MVHGVEIDEIGPIQIDPIYNISEDPQSEISGYTKDIPGWHVNFRIHDEVAYMLTNGIDQVGTEGEQLDIWNRTRILVLIPELQPVYLTAIGETDKLGYVGLSGLRLYDPSVVTKPVRRWL